MKNFFILAKSYLLIALLSWPGVGSAGSGTLSNPLIFSNNGQNGIAELIKAIVNMVQIIAVPFIVFFIIYGGFLYVTARGNPETIQKASRAIVYSLIGAAVVLGAQAISIIAGNTATQFNP